MLNSVGQKHVVKVIYAQIAQFILCIKGNCTDDTEAEADVLQGVTWERCARGLDSVDSEIRSMVKSDADGIGTLLTLLNDLQIDNQVYRDQRFEEMATEFSNLVE